MNQHKPIQVQEYNGVKIFFKTDGTFYCNVINNSEDFNKKSFESTRLESIKKAIDNYQSSVIENGEQYFDIDINNANISVLQVVKQVGTRKWFDDGTDTTLMSRSHLYPRVNETKQEFKELQVLLKELQELQEIQTKQYKLQQEIRTQVNSKLRFLHKEKLG